MDPDRIYKLKLCPECNYPMRPDGRCWVCPKCGYSECEVG